MLQCESPELVPHQTVHDEVGRGHEAEKDVRHKSQEVIPDREALSQVTLINTRPGNKKLSEWMVCLDTNIPCLSL